MLRDNLELTLKEGEAWITLIFKLMAQFQTRRARCALRVVLFSAVLSKVQVKLTPGFQVAACGGVDGDSAR